METNQSNTFDELENLKKEQTFLKLKIRELKLANKSLRSSYEKAMSRYKPGVGHNDTEPKWCVSLCEYAKTRGMSPGRLINKLKDADFLFVDRHISYLKQPDKYGYLVYYKSRKVFDGSVTLESMYWTAEGVAFLDDFVKANYKKQPKREFSY
jgi:hypothetical protein